MPESSGEGEVGHKASAGNIQTKARAAQDRADQLAKLLDVSSVAELPSFEVIYRETRDACLRQWSDVDALDSKATNVLAFDGILIGGLFAIVAEGNLFQTIGSGCISGLGVGVIWGGLLLAVGSLILGISALHVREWTQLFNPEVVCAKRIKDQEDKTRIQLLSNWIDAYKKNQAMREQKAKLLQWSIWLLGLAIFVFTVFVGFYVWVLAHL